MILKTVKGLCTAMHAGEIDIRLELRAVDVINDVPSLCAHDDGTLVVDLRTNVWGCRECCIDGLLADLREDREPAGTCALCDRPAKTVCLHPVTLADDVVGVVMARSCHECTEHRTLGFLGPHAEA